ncbi:MAG: prolipoprotein diacylglyceryl transferase [Oscillospiraceae bacterium]|nr:prolipoprotein diacylglyceryl transferase [Oscillospiraceae bacterium]
MVNTIEFPGLGIQFEVSKIAFTIFGYEFRYYTLLITLGFILAFFYFYKNHRRFGINFDKSMDAICLGLVGAVVGARAYYVLFNLSDFSGDWTRVFRIWEGGIAIYGAIIGAFGLGIIALKIHKIKIMPMFDIVAIGFLIGQSVGRWGNFFNVEAFGSNTTLPWGMSGQAITKYLSANFREIMALNGGVAPGFTEPVHPCFLYESLWCALGFVLLHFLSKKRRYDGQIFLSYLAFYGLGRFFIEGLRLDSLILGTGTLRVSQMLAALLVITSLLIMLIIRMKIKAEHSDEYLMLYAKTPECAEMYAEIDRKALNKKNRKKGIAEIEDDEGEGEIEVEIEDGEDDGKGETQEEIGGQEDDREEQQ